MANGHKTGGRQKGTPNRTTRAVKEALAEAFEELGGVPSLVKWGKDEPSEFYKLWVKLLPQEVNHGVQEDNPLAQILQQVGGATIKPQRESEG